MANTRAQIKTIVKLHTAKGAEKDTLIELLCNYALDESVLRHSFQEVSTRSDVAVLADAVSLTLPSNLLDILWIACLDSDDESRTPIWLKSQRWFNENVGEPSANVAGVPKYAVKLGGELFFDRPFDDAYSIRVCYTPLKPVFATDATENPIPVLDQFLIHYVTAQVFMSIEDTKNYEYWMMQAIGRGFDWKGGSFDAAVQADERLQARVGIVEVAPVVTNQRVFKTEDGRSWFEPDTGS